MWTEAALAVVSVSLTIAIVLSLRMASAERRILFAAALQAEGKTDAARRAAGPTHAEAQASVEQQIKMMKESTDEHGVFAGNPYAQPKKPEGI